MSIIIDTSAPGRNRKRINPAPFAAFPRLPAAAGSCRCRVLHRRSGRTLLDQLDRRQANGRSVGSLVVGWQEVREDGIAIDQRLCRSRRQSG